MSDQAPQTDDKKLTAKQLAFVAHYMECHNATEAAKRAGYSEKTAQQMGSENLSKPVIQAEIARRTEAIMPKAEIVQRLADIARNDMHHYFTIGEEEVVIRETVTLEEVEPPPDPKKSPKLTVIQRTVTETIAKRPVVMLDLRKAEHDKKLHLVKKYSTGPQGERIELYDAQGALQQLGEFHGMWIKKQEISGDPERPVVVKVINGVSMDDL